MHKVRAGMLLRVKDLAGRTTEVEADLSWRIKDLCRRAAELLSLPPKTRCCLYSKGGRLAEASLLGSAGLSSDEVLVLIALRRRGAREQVEGVDAGCGAPPTPVKAARSFNPPLDPDVSFLDGQIDHFGALPSGCLKAPTSSSAHEPVEPAGSSKHSGFDSAQATEPSHQPSLLSRLSCKNGACKAAEQSRPERCSCDRPLRETTAQSFDPQSCVDWSQGQVHDRQQPTGDVHATSSQATSTPQEQTASDPIDSQARSNVHCSAKPRSRAARSRSSPASQTEELEEKDKKTRPQLPAALAELEAKFNVVNAVWGFMSGQMVETTWERLLQGIEGMAASSAPRVTLQDIESMATMAPHVVKLVEVPDGPVLSGAEVGLRERGGGSGVQESPLEGAAAAHPWAPPEASDATEAVMTAQTMPPQPSDTLREDWGEGAEEALALHSGSNGEIPVRDGSGGAVDKEMSKTGACATLQDMSALLPGNIIVKLVDNLSLRPGSTSHVDKASAAGRERAWRPVDEGPQMMRLSVTAIRNRVERRRAAFAEALEAAAQRVRSDWLMQLGGSCTAPGISLEADSQVNLAAFNDLPLSIFLAEAQAHAAWAQKGDDKQAAASSPAKKGAGTGGCRHGEGRGTRKRGAKAAPASNEGPVQKRTREQRSDKGAHTKEASASCPGEETRVGSAADTGTPGTPASRERHAEAATDKGDGVEGGKGEEEEAEGGGSVLDPVVPRLSREERRQMRWRRACNSTKELSAEDMLEHLREGLGGSGQIVHCERLRQRKARHRRVPLPLGEGTLAVLQSMGISRLYHHQAIAIEAAMRGRHVVVSTPTASGKSLCYNIPVFEAYQHDSDACALYLFPTKALTQDQQRALEQLTAPLSSPPNMAIYDGDTPFSKRAGVRSSANILLTNPDMLHMTILPHYKDFARLLANLKYVVVDEAHSYSGAFGCHTAIILRRLRRICARVYGSFPTFIVCTATCANPEDHARTLVGVDDWCAVGAEDDGSPCGDKTFVLWNPPIIGAPAVVVANRSRRRQTPAARDPAPVLEQRRCSPIVEVALLLAEMVQHNLRCLAFCKTRKLSELVLSYCKDMLRERCPELVNSVVAYRSGYSAEDRRRIERELFGGRLRAVAATNALELGVDIGSLDATVHLGFQGTVASLWQQAGRAGRREKASLSIYVAFGCPLDQYFMAAPERLFSRPIEAARLDCQNPEVLKQQVMCGAAELPLLVDNDAPFFFSQGPPRRGRARLLTNGETGGSEGQGRLKPKVEVPCESETAAEMLISGCASTGDSAAERSPRVATVGKGAGFSGSAQGQEEPAGDSGAAPSAEPRSRNLVSCIAGPQGGEECPLGTAEGVQGALVGGRGILPLQSSRGRMEALVKHLNAAGMLGRSPTDCHVDQSWRYIGAASRVWNEVKIRAIDEHCFAVIDERTGAVMEEIEEKKAFFTIFEGAVYMQQGKTYIVTSLDLKRREAKCRRSNVRYWTSVLDMTDVQLTGGTLAYETVSGGTPGAGPPSWEAPAQALGTSGRGCVANPGELKAEDRYWDTGPTRGTPLVEYSPSGIVTSAQWSTCIVSTSYPSYRKVWRGANIPFDQVDLFLPRITFPTQACWIRVPSRAREVVAGLNKEGEPPLDYGSSLHAACHAVLNVLPAYLACNAADVGSECKHPNDTRFFPDRVLLFDRHTGGIGLAPQICNVFGDLLLAALQVVSRCECTDEGGCPGCIQTAGCASYNKVLCKAGGKAILSVLVEAECKTAEEHRAT